MKYLIFFFISILFLNYSHSDEIFKMNVPNNKDDSSIPSDKKNTPQTFDKNAIPKIPPGAFDSSGGIVYPVPSKGPTKEQLEKLPPEIRALEEEKIKRTSRTSNIEYKKSFLNHEKKNLEFQYIGCKQEVERMKKAKVNQKEIENSFWFSCNKEYENKTSLIDKELRSLK